MYEIKNDNGAVINNSDGILLFVQTHFKTLYSKVNVREKDHYPYIKECKSRLDSEEYSELTDSIEEDEIWKVIKKMKDRKTPGIDGLPAEFYKRYWKIIKNEFIQVCKFIFQNNVLSNHRKRAL